MTTAALVCNGVIDVNVTPPTCSSAWLAVDTGLGFDVSQLDPAVVVQAFTAGAAITFPAFAIAWGAAFVLKGLGGRNG